MIEPLGGNWDLCRILPHARDRGVRVYLAMNTVLTEADLPEAISMVHQVAPLSPDALIVQDLGLMRILRDFFPALKFHVSTQAGCGSTARITSYNVCYTKLLRFTAASAISAGRS